MAQRLRDGLMYGMAVLAILLGLALIQISETEAASVDIQIVQPPGFRSWGFSPNTVQVTVGDTVTWTNTGSAGHTVTAGQGAFNSGNVAPGGRFTFTATTPGVVAYHCNFHPGMQGSLVILAAPVPEPAPVPAEPQPMEPEPLAEPAPIDMGEPSEDTEPQ